MPDIFYIIIVITLMIIFIPNNNKLSPFEKYLNRRYFKNLHKDKTDQEVAEIIKQAYIDKEKDRFRRKPHAFSRLTTHPNKKFIFHGQCLDCATPEKHGNRVCLKCDVFPGNWDIAYSQYIEEKKEKLWKQAQYYHSYYAFM